MPLYHVTWKIDLDADSPLEAAQKAREIQQNQDPESCAHVYEVQDVYEVQEPQRVSLKIDLDEIEGRV